MIGGRSGESATITSVHDLTLLHQSSLRTVPLMLPTMLNRYFESSVKILQSEYNKTKVLDQSGNAGTVREQIIKDFLSSHLPDRKGHGWRDNRFSLRTHKAARYCRGP